MQEATTKTKPNGSGQVISIVPGLLTVTRKTSLIRTLRNVYGEAAFSLVPRTFKLPDELDDWAEWVRRNPHADNGLWMLKNNKQRGTGLRLVTTREAFKACFETTTRPGLEGVPLYRWYLAQQYITNPLLIQGRKFGLRVWVLVPDVNPLRVYLHQNGLLLFSEAAYDGGNIQAEDCSELPRGHVTNYAQNENGMVWDLHMFRRHIGAGNFQRVWQQVQCAAARTFSAALRRVQEVELQMDLPAHSCYQFFGLDFLIDDRLTAWLMEVNATPSMNVCHSDPGVEQLIYDQKWPVTWDMFNMLSIGPQRFRAPTQREASPISQVHAVLLNPKFRFSNSYNFS